MLRIQSMSKADIRKHKPKQQKTLLIAIQDYEKSILPFKERTNYLTRRLYKDIQFMYFDDYNKEDIINEPYYPFIFTKKEANTIIDFLETHYEKQDFDNIIIHCEAGISRSHAIALFTAKYFEKDTELYNTLLNQENKIYGGNNHIYELLEQTYKEKQLTKESNNINLLR